MSLDSFHTHCTVSKSPSPPLQSTPCIRQGRDMHKALQEDDQKASEDSWCRVLTRRPSFSQPHFPTSLISLEESETPTGSSESSKGSQRRASLRPLGNSHDETSRLRQLSLVTSSSPCDATTTNGSIKSCSGHVPKQVFPWMKETRHSAKQKTNLPFSGIFFSLSSSPPWEFWEL